MAPRADLTGQIVDGWNVIAKAPAQNRVPFWTVTHEPCGAVADLPHVSLVKALAGKGGLARCVVCEPAGPAIDHGMHLACGTAHLIGTACGAEPHQVDTAPHAGMCGDSPWSLGGDVPEDMPEPPADVARGIVGHLSLTGEYVIEVEAARRNVNPASLAEPEPAARLEDASTGGLVVHGRVDRLDEPQPLVDVIMADLNRYDDALPEGVKPSSPGASNLGGCERRLGHRLAFGKQPLTENDLDRMLKAWVGRAVHKRLAAIFGVEEFLSNHWTSAPLVNPIDLYWMSHAMVVDFKVSGPSVCDKAARGKVDEKYEVQLDLYGLCMETEGYPVERVALLFIPRNGAKLTESVWYSRPYNRDRAVAYLARRDRVAALVSFAAQNDVPPERVLPALSIQEDYCGSCPALGTHCGGAAIVAPTAPALRMVGGAA